MFYKGNYIFTSESVCNGHPDKISDQISDVIVDEILKNDPNGRAAIETMVTTNQVFIVGEVRSQKKIDYETIARSEIKRLGYTDDRFQFTDKSNISLFVHEQSSEIAKGVDKKGAGDQGMMFGFACRDTKQLMPMPITLAHALTEKIDKVRQKKILPYLRPDGKSQVTVEYKNGLPYKIQSVVLAVPHSEKIKLKQVSKDLYKEVICVVLEQYGFKIPFKDIIVNGTGLWHIGGPASDSGLTGRKIVVDTYGGYARVGGGCFSGKDPTKVDRSGAYAARFIAKNVVANKLAEKCEVSLAYFIGAKKPIMQEIETFGTEKVSDKILKAFVKKLLDTSVEGIIDSLALNRPIYHKTAAYGHFGRKEFPWEQIRKV